MSLCCFVLCCHPVELDRCSLCSDENWTGSKNPAGVRTMLTLWWSCCHRSNCSLHCSVKPKGGTIHYKIMVPQWESRRRVKKDGRDESGWLLFCLQTYAVCFITRTCWCRQTGGTMRWMGEWGNLQFLKLTRHPSKPLTKLEFLTKGNLILLNC